MLETNKQVESNKRMWIAGICLVVMIAILAMVYTIFSPKAVTGDKNIVVEVVMPGQDSKEYEINTDEEYLRGALEQESLIEGTDGEFGLFVKTVDGVTADDSNKEWWLFTKDGDQINTSVDDTAIEDGDHFEITLTVGY